jgi:hypothetical protein
MGRYISASDLENEGVSVNHEAGEAEVIKLAEQYVDRETRQFFDKRDALTLKFDGDGREFINLPVPLITLTSAKMGTYDVAITSFDFTPGQYNPDLPTSQDHRFSPVISWKRGDIASPRNLFAAGRFAEGFQNIEITGSWGFVDWNGASAYTTPKEIKRLCILLVKRIFNHPLNSRAAAQIQNESRAFMRSAGGGHFYRVPDWVTSGGPTGDYQIDRVIAEYMSQWRYLGSVI